MKGFGTMFAALGLAIGAVAFAHAQQIGANDLLRGLADPSRWLTYSGDYASTRHSPLTQITPENVARLTPVWTFDSGLGAGRRDKFEATPIVIDGTMYVTGLYNHAWAIDGRTGKVIWHYQRKLPIDLRVCCGMVNRGFAISGDRLFMTTLDAHVMAIDRKTGAPIWDVPLADYRLGYSSTVAPLVVKDKLIVGMAGGELATRGFLDAYSLETGKRLWRFNTIPAPGEPGGNTWPAGHFERGGGATWITGSYDPDLNLLYWGIGNPNPLFYGGIRNGDNLYTASVVALDADTGRLRWHFQYTPHDEHDWDSNQVQVLADLTISGRARKTLITANRNGFFYVLDRTNGALIQAKPSVTTTGAR
jgi:alcohol dehydrogenase (cytochrome c)